MKTGGTGVDPMWHLLAIHLTAFMVMLTAPWAPAAAQEQHDTAVEARAWVDPWPAVVSLKGYVVRKRFYGAPGYGETPEEDYKANAWLLLLDAPINIRADEESEESESLDIRRVQLVILKDNDKNLRKKLRSLLGEEVYATGMLYHGNTGWYWTPIGMELQSIGLVPRGTCDSDCNRQLSNQAPGPSH